jgi:hypothetical protein
VGSNVYEYMGIWEIHGPNLLDILMTILRLSDLALDFILE